LCRGETLEKRGLADPGLAADQDNSALPGVEDVERHCQLA
jgi:hypothetical protein